MFVGQGLPLRPFLENALHVSDSTPKVQYEEITKSITEQRSALKNTLMSAAPRTDDQDQLERSSSSKKPRTSTPRSPEALQNDGDGPNLPPSEVVDQMVEYYSYNVHTWLPMLHVRQFCEQLRDSSKRQKSHTILLAIVSEGLRFTKCTFTESVAISASSLRYRQTVILHGMEKFLLENLQAMIIVAFDIIGSGQGPSVWLLIGSIAETAKQLQLSIEDTDSDNKSQPRASGLLIERMSFLRPTKTWIESEERRRVFWNIFLMDRLCSVATGWNNSLTDMDIRRRLPCEKAIWQEGRSVQTPYFGIAERSQVSTEQARIPNSERKSANEEEVESLGGFAFCIEATESLNLVTTFFLRQPVNFSQAQQTQVWLMNFKDLGLRLVNYIYSCSLL